MAESPFRNRFLRPLAAALQHGDMERLGIGNTMRISKVWNRVRHGHLQARLEDLYRERWNELVAENGAPRGDLRLHDGWALDTSGSLPHLDRLLAEAAQLIAERGGRRLKDTGKLFIQDILAAEDLERFPSFLDFALSSAVLSPVAAYLGAVPLLSRTLAPGVRLAESSADYDDDPDEPPKESQLFHLDHHDSPLVYVIVLLKDVGPDSGPFCFLPASVSARAAKALGYRRRGQPYRVTDEEMFRVVDPSEVRTLMYLKGTVLFIDSSRCFHYGSRRAVDRRYQMMYNFVSACRTDLSESFMPLRTFPCPADASYLRRLVSRRESPV